MTRNDGTARSWPGLKIHRIKGGRLYTLRMDVPFYEPRNVQINFRNWSRHPVVRVDGPDSRHRFDRNGWLCMWYPTDPPEQRWLFEDGLLALLNTIQAHLFREAWWRETGEWLGPEAPHVSVKEQVKETNERDVRTPDSRRRHER